MKSKLVLLSCLTVGTLFTATATATRAAIEVSDRVAIGGFFSQGYLYSSNNNYPTADRDGTWDFREMAVNASTTLGAHTRIGAQAFAQRLGALGDDKVILDWAVADYNFSPAFGVRLGRVKYPKGLYGEALDLDVVRTGVFLPNAVYSPILRDFSASFDGGMAYGSLNVGRSSIDYKLFYGDIPMSPAKGVAEFYNNSGLYAASGVAKLSIDSVTGGQLVWNTPVSGLKFVYSYSYFTNLATDGPFAAYAPANLHSNFSRYSWNTASGEYNVGNWSFATEWQRTGGALSYSAAPVLPLVNDYSGWQGWYVSAARRFGDRFQLGAYYGSLQARYTTSSAPSSYQRDSAVSFRYDASEHVVFKLEVHRIDGTYQTFNTLRIPNPAATRQDRTTVFAAKTTLSF
jgi:hypothetical protein